MSNIQTGPSSMPEDLSLFFIATAPTESYTLSLHDALPISPVPRGRRRRAGGLRGAPSTRRRYLRDEAERHADRKSTRLNSSHEWISYAVFCLKKKNTMQLHNNFNDRGLDASHEA